MHLRLERFLFYDESTIGKLYVNGIFQCYTLEDKVRKEKVFGKTAIPYGKYELIINQSKRFKQDLPLLLNVPGFEGIRIHPGNTEIDTLGCILPGELYKKDFILFSKTAFKALFSKLQIAFNQKKHIDIEIVAT